MFSTGWKLLKPVLKSPEFQKDVVMGAGQDQVEYWGSTRLQTGQPTGGNVFGQGVSILFRKLMGWTAQSPGITPRNYMQAKGIPAPQVTHIINGKYNRIEAPVWKILQYELGLSPTEVVDIRSDIDACLSDLAESVRQSTPGRNPTNE